MGKKSKFRSKRKGKIMLSCVIIIGVILGFCGYYNYTNITEKVPGMGTSNEATEQDGPTPVTGSGNPD